MANRYKINELTIKKNCTICINKFCTFVDIDIIKLLESDRYVIIKMEKYGRVSAISILIYYTIC
jgi:hypothetical protein